MDLLGEEDHSGAGAEGRGLTDELVKHGEEAVALQVAEEGGGFASGEDKAVEAVKLIGAANKFCFRADGREGFGVGLVSSLKGEYTDYGFSVAVQDTPPPPVKVRKVFKVKNLGLDFESRQGTQEISGKRAENFCFLR